MSYELFFYIFLLVIGVIGRPCLGRVAGDVDLGVHRGATPFSCARRESRCASLRLSSECTHAKFSGMNLALFDCKCPIMCQVADSYKGILVSASCTVFSPKSTCAGGDGGGDGLGRMGFERHSAGFPPACNRWRRGGKDSRARAKLPATVAVKSCMNEC